MSDQYSSFKINADHPCLAGHFPGNPIVPGVVILDEISNAILGKFNEYKIIGFSSVKFLQPLLAEQNVSVNIVEPSEPDKVDVKIKFNANLNDTVIAQGEIKLERVD